jgi:hypothetical protein
MQRNILEELPPEVPCDYIPPHLGLSDLVKLMSVSTYTQGLFLHPLIQRQASKLLEVVLRADYVTAKKYMLANPRLMFVYHEGVSPLKLAASKVDTYMVRIFLEAVKPDAGLREKFFQQMNEDIKQDGFRIIFIAYETFIAKYRRWKNGQMTEDKLDEAWTELGQRQRLFPQHILKEFCRVDGKWGVASCFNNAKPPIQPDFSIVNGKTYEQRQPVLVFEDAEKEVYTLVRGEWHGGKGCFANAHAQIPDSQEFDAEPWVEDFAIFRHLCEVRKNDLERLKNPACLVPAPSFRLCVTF